VADFALTKEYQGALISVAGGLGSRIVMPSLIKGDAGKSSATTDPGAKPEKTKNDRAASCVTAAAEAVNAFMRSSASKKSKKTAEENYERARELNDSIPASVPMPAPEEPAVEPSKTPPSTITITTTTTSSNTSSLTTTAATDKSAVPTPTPTGADPGAISNSSLKSSSSGRACNDSSFEGVVSCAVANSEGSLGQQIEAPRFRRAIEQFLGSRAEELLKMEGPADVIQRAFDKARLSPNHRETLNDALDEVRGGVDGMSQEKAGKSFKATARAESRSGWTGMLASIPGLSRLLPIQQEQRGMLREGEQAPSISPEESSDGLEEDRTVSIFKRVSRRYRESFESLARQEYSTEQNRLLSK